MISKTRTPLNYPLLVLLLCGIFASNLVAEDITDAEAEKFFENNIRPLLVDKCIKCHDESKQKGGLRLDGIGHILAGGESGPALEPHKPAESLLIEAVRYESYEMPPDGQMSDEEIDLLVKWVEMGAPWPGGDRNLPARSEASKISADDRDFWVFQPLAHPELPLPDNKWCQTKIDQFILKTLQDNKIEPAKEADRATLVRRLYYDLTGLPPTPEQTANFIANRSPTAYKELVDELLASPRYGEHWARFWLDLVRYAESDGFRKDDYRPDAWLYRDYVINAFNNDKPYDLFVQEQLAGDELSPDNPDAVVATGFLRHGIYEYNQRDARTQWQDILNDITDTVGDTFLGMGMGCARCHDHKFDPILQKDYFRLQAFFANVSFENKTPIATLDALAEYEQQLKGWEDATAEIRKELDALEAPKLKELANEMIGMFPEDIQEIMAKTPATRDSHENQLAYLVERQIEDKYTTLSNKFKGGPKKDWDTLKEKLKEFDHLKPAPLQLGQTIRDFGRDTTPVFIPGKERLGEVQPGFLTIFEEEPAIVESLPEVPDTSGRRTALAKWLTRADHPLTTRVIVNRIWKEHFGTGIVATLSDFGHLGETPSHPELLDWLAVNFVENGWSLKWLHREIVLSSTYRQTSLRQDEQAQVLDPDNRLLWRYNVKRLGAEQIRDALLFTSGELKTKDGGASESAATSTRRSVYAKVMRNDRDPLLDVFDFPDRMTSSGSRNSTTTPTQSLELINGNWTMQRAQALAKRVFDQTKGGGAESSVHEAVQLALGREPTEQELRNFTEFLESGNQSATVMSISNMPGTKLSALEVSDVGSQLPLQTLSADKLPTNQFTIEATINLRNLYPDSTVRTIASHWDSNTRNPGWSLGITSTKSSYTPRNLIFQFVGLNSEGSRAYEVIPSGILIDLNTPYQIVGSVNLEDASEQGVYFEVKNLITGEVKTANMKHTVIKSEPHENPFVIGGRAANQRQRFDGWIGNVTLSNVAVPNEQLGHPTREPGDVFAAWNFQADPLIDTVHQQRLIPFGNATGVSPSLVDLCHVLLNSNEFLYID